MPKQGWERRRAVSECKNDDAKTVTCQLTEGQRTQSRQPPPSDTNLRQRLQSPHDDDGPHGRATVPGWRLATLLPTGVRRTL